MAKKNYLITILFMLALTASNLKATDQFSSAIERFKNYSPYLAVPAFNIAQYNYRKNIPIEQRYLKPLPAYFGPTATATVASTLLNRDLGWHAAIGWSLLKNIPAWLSSAIFTHLEVLNDLNKKNKAQAQEEATMLLKKTKQTSDEMEEINRLLQETKQALNQNPPTNENLQAIIALSDTITNKINSSQLIPQLEKIKYTVKAQSLQTKAFERKDLIVIADNIKSKMAQAPLLAITDDTPIDTIEQSINDLQIDSNHYLQSSATKNEQQLHQQVAALSEIINRVIDIPTLISLLYITDILREQIAKNKTVAEDEKTLLNNYLKDEHANITNRLYQEVTSTHDDSSKELDLIAKSVNYLLLEKILNVTDNFIDDLQLDKTISKMVHHVIINIIKCRDASYYYLLPQTNTLRENFYLLSDIYLRARALRREEQRIQETIFIR